VTICVETAQKFIQWFFLMITDLRKMAKFKIDMKISI
jgi:hypothetical protein